MMTVPGHQISPLPGSPPILDTRLVGIRDRIRRGLDSLVRQVPGARGAMTAFDSLDAALDSAPEETDWAAIFADINAAAGSRPRSRDQYGLLALHWYTVAAAELVFVVGFSHSARLPEVDSCLARAERAARRHRNGLTAYQD